MVKVIWSFIAGGGWKWLLVAAILSFALKFGYEAYTDYQGMIEQQIQDAAKIATLDSANQVNQATIEKMVEQAKRNEANRLALQNSLNFSEIRVDELQALLADHNLEFLAINKPGLIENRINNATIDVFRSIECSTDPNCVQ